MYIARRVLSQAALYSLSRRILVNVTTKSLRLRNVRNLTLTSKKCAKSKKPADDDEDEEVISEPIKFSTSKAGQKSWNVDRSLGSTHQRPWWKVLPISLFGVGFILWCALRGESDIDEQLEKNLYEHLPGLLSEEEKSSQNQSNSVGLK